jgi:chorismate mutase
LLLALVLEQASSERVIKLRKQRSIEDWRTSIDAVDSELLCLLNRRAAMALEAGRAKISAGLPICDDQRERDVIERSRRANPGPLDGTGVEKIFRRIIRETRSIEVRHLSGNNLKPNSMKEFEGEQES